MQKNWCNLIIKIKMILNQLNLKTLNKQPNTNTLPEKVLQFGTGVLLRGLPDYFIDKANKQGVFNGSIVVVKSTQQGEVDAFKKQDNLYTLCTRGLEDGQLIERNTIISAISSVLVAKTQWQQILAFAQNEALQIIISNTTEVGLTLVPDDDINLNPPLSYPGKLLAFLQARYKAFAGSVASGMIIIPTELISDNGTLLKSIVLQLAHNNKLDAAFIDWLNHANYFCNSLVDRIVPGKPEKNILNELAQQLGYADALLTMCEPYSLWAIEGDDYIKSKLTFANTDSAVVIVPNINNYKELKLRLLNGTHTFSCAAAFLAGFTNVDEATNNPYISNYITSLMQNEIAPAIANETDLQLAKQYGNKVFERFKNSNIKHKWLNITLNYSAKLKLRCVPILTKYYQKFNTVPQNIAFGFAAYLVFMKNTHKTETGYMGVFNGQSYLINDEEAILFSEKWNNASVELMVNEVLGNTNLWGQNLNLLPNFEATVTAQVNNINKIGVLETLKMV